MTLPLDKFNNAVRYFLCEQVLIPLSEILKNEYDVKISVEEMLYKLSVPVPKTPIINNSLPIAKNSTFITNSDNTKTCIYKMRGNKMCSNPAEKDSEYCAACLKRPNVKTKLKKEQASKESAELQGMSKIRGVRIDTVNGVDRFKISDKYIVERRNDSKMYLISVLDNDQETPILSDQDRSELDAMGIIIE